MRIKCLAIAFVALICNAQNEAVGFGFPGYKQGSDTIMNYQQLAGFFNKLNSLENSDTNTTVSILHIGDSHIQADFLTREIRNSLQKRFGNAGRGLVFPYRLTKSNESYDYRSASDNNWKWETVRSRKRDFEPGISGASISSPNDLFTLRIKINNRDSADNSFDKLQLICRNDSSGLIAFVDDIKNNERRLLAFSDDSTYETTFGQRTDQVAVQSYGNLLIDGVVLKNSNKGILYHVVGINGSHYTDYNQSPVFFAEMPLLQPDLIVISLGTNEGVNSRVSSQAVKNEVAKMMTNIRAVQQQVPVLIVTPFDNYYRRKKFNTYLGLVRKGLVEACREQNIACLDMYDITGAYKSAAVWKAQGLITSDRIHYSAQGYRLQGKMIYNALINSYSKYVAH